MNAEQAIQAFASAGGHLPREAIDWAREHWETAAPEFLAVLDRYVAGTDRSLEADDTLGIILHLCAEMKETRAFPGLCDLAMTSAIEDVLGLYVDAALSAILPATFDGDLARVFRLIEAPGAHVAGKKAGLHVLACAAVAGLVPRDEVETYLGELFETLEPRVGADDVWCEWVIVTAILGFDRLTPLVEQAFREERFGATHVDLEYYRNTLHASSQRDGWASLKAEEIEPVTDAVASLSRWHFSNPNWEEDFLNSADAKAMREAAAAVVKKATILSRPVIQKVSPQARNPNRTVGRNDPCPCGSGKKYKKCCLLERLAS